ncbi:hypothetical protein HDC93_003554 [Streptomyces sp. AK010]|nr:hypothetical protein [Streptomyces sp. AK010]
MSAVRTRRPSPYGVHCTTAPPPCSRNATSCARAVGTLRSSWPGSRGLPEAVRALADAGFGDRVLLGADTTMAAARSVDGGPGMPYLLRRARPRLVHAVGEELVERILTENPGRAFGTEWR